MQRWYYSHSHSKFNKESKIIINLLHWKISERNIRKSRIVSEEMNTVLFFGRRLSCPIRSRSLQQNRLYIVIGPHRLKVVVVFPHRLKKCFRTSKKKKNKSLRGRVREIISRYLTVFTYQHWVYTTPTIVSGDQFVHQEGFTNTQISSDSRFKGFMLGLTLAPK